MQANSPAKIDTTPGQAGPVIDYARTVDELLELYSGLDQAAVALPRTDVGYISHRPPSRWWFQVGEVPFHSFYRPVVRSLLHWHFRRRLSALRQHILLETRFSEDAVKGALAKIDRAIDFWRLRITVGSVLFGWVLPLWGPALAAWRWAFPQAF